mgnify:FL=1
MTILFTLIGFLVGVAATITFIKHIPVSAYKMKLMQGRTLEKEAERLKTEGEQILTNITDLTNQVNQMHANA